MFLRKICIENYRLLKNVEIDLDKSMTVFVGKNNTGKTSVMRFMQEVLGNKSSLSIDDYSLGCHSILHEKVKDFWNNDCACEQDFWDDLPLIKMRMYIDYEQESSEESLGALSDFILDLNDKERTAVIDVNFDVSLNIGDTLKLCKAEYDNGIADSNSELENKEILGQKVFTSIIAKYFPKMFQKKIFAVNIENEDDKQSREQSCLNKLFFFKVISAERALDEGEDRNTNPLAYLLKDLFKTDLSAEERNFKEAALSLQAVVSKSNYQLQNSINQEMTDIVKSMMKFGYPNAEQMQIEANANLQLENQIISHTALIYTNGNDGVLPSTHNGLGYKNLIKIAFSLLNFKREFSQQEAKIPIIYIEEPEAHMHPQLQSVFAKYVKDFLQIDATKRDIQVILTTHSSHIANTVDFREICYMRKNGLQVEAKNLSQFCESTKNEAFLRQYLKLSFCDLYFCDKAILVEGTSERLLLPDMIAKCDAAGYFQNTDTDTNNPTLAHQYYSILEVGGAYAHKFIDFVRFLEIPTLILTDIDFVKPGKARLVASTSDEATSTSNATIKHWIRKILGKGNDFPVDKEALLAFLENSSKRIKDGICLEYQAEEKGMYPRSLEDAIINVNREMYGIRNNDKDIKYDASKHGKKTEFALNLLTKEEYRKYEIPSYIRNGLIWLNGAGL